MSRPKLNRVVLAVLIVGFVAAQGLNSASPEGLRVPRSGQSGAGGSVRGGTLTLLGQSDIINLDTVSADYPPSNMLERVSAPNPSTIVFRLLEPASDFLNILALGFGSTLPIEYMKYLPDSAAFRHMAAPRWMPEWFGNNGRTNLQPLFTDPGLGSFDYGGYSSRVTDSIISQALAPPSATVAAGLWSQAQRQVLNNAATIPVDYQKWPIYHSSAVHGCRFWWDDLNCDPTNVWLSS